MRQQVLIGRRTAPPGRGKGFPPVGDGRWAGGGRRDARDAWIAEGAWSGAFSFLLFFCAHFRAFPHFCARRAIFPRIFDFGLMGIAGLGPGGSSASGRRKRRGRGWTVLRERLEGVELAAAVGRPGPSESASKPRRLSGQAPNAFGAGWTQSIRFAGRGVSRLSVFSHADCVSFVHNRLSHNRGGEGKCSIGCIGCIGYFSAGVWFGVFQGFLNAKSANKVLGTKHVAGYRNF